MIITVTITIISTATKVSVPVCVCVCMYMCVCLRMQTCASLKDWHAGNSLFLGGAGVEPEMEVIPGAKVQGWLVTGCLVPRLGRGDCEHGQERYCEC